MHLKNDKIEFMTFENANEVIEETFESFFSKILNWFGNIVERKRSYLQFGSTVVSRKILNVMVHILILQTEKKKEKSNNKPKIQR